MHPGYLDMPQLSAAYQTGTLSPTEVVQSLLDRIERANPTLHAFVTITPQAALAAARRAEREIRSGGVRGPLHGVPIVHKDIFYTKGVLTTGNSRVLADHVPTYDATVVARLAQAGAISLGKTVTNEYACGDPDLYGFPLNPYDPTCVPGGSSSGSAVAVAAGLCYGGTGTDTGGSIRGPASYCGLVGLKPTFGRVSRHGILPLSQTLDHPGPLTRTVADAALMFQAMAGLDRHDPSTKGVPVIPFQPGSHLGLKGVRIGVPSNIESLPSTDPEMKAAVMRALITFQDLGATVEGMDLPMLDQVLHAGAVILNAEAYTIHRAQLEEKGDLYGPITRRRLSVGREHPAYEYLECLAHREAFIAALKPIFDRFDLLITPANLGPAFAVADFGKPMADYGPYFRPGNVAGAPCLVQPCGFSEAGLPLGMQLMAKWWDETTLFRVGHAFEQATAWHERRPPVADFLPE